MSFNAHRQVYMEGCFIAFDDHVSEIELAVRGTLEMQGQQLVVRNCVIRIPTGTTMRVPEDLMRFVDPATLWHWVELGRTRWHTEAKPVAQRIPRPC